MHKNRMFYVLIYINNHIITSIDWMLSKRLLGLCPLTPEEIVLVLQPLGFGRKTQIYITTRERYSVVKKDSPIFQSK